MNILIDTNVVLDALAHREPWNEAAEKLFIMSANDIITLNISSSAVTDIYYILHRWLHDKEKTKEILQKIFVIINILDTTAKDCEDALLSHVTDYEDAVNEAVAKRNKLDYIVTRNVKDYEKSKVNAILPDAFVKLIEEQPE